MGVFCPPKEGLLYHTTLLHRPHCSKTEGKIAHQLKANRPQDSRPGIPPLSTPAHNHGQPLTAFLLVTLVEAVRQPVTLPGTRNAPPVAAHEVTWDVALIGEVVPREQLALCKGRREQRSQKAGTRTTAKGLSPGLVGEADVQTG